MNVFPSMIQQIDLNPGLLLEARETLAHWENKKLAPSHRIEEWRMILDKAIESESGRQELFALLMDQSDGARRKKDFAPFAGLLPREKRREIIAACVYDH